MELSAKQIEAVRRSGLLGPDADRLSGNELYDAAYEVMVNEAPIVEEYTANGSYDEMFPIEIRGVTGTYFVTASEFDDAGFFDQFSDAQNEVRRNFGDMDSFSVKRRS